MSARLCRAQLLIVAFGSLLIAVSAEAQVSIELHDLGVPAGTEGSQATAINNRGDVAGEAAFIVGSINVGVPFVWTRRNGFTLILGGTPGRTFDINDRGEVVGVFASGDETHGYLWSPRSGVVDLGRNFLAEAINNRGQVAGQCIISGVTHACLWERGFLVPLDVPFGDVSFVADINARGQVLGFACAETCTGWVWTKNKGAKAIPIYPEGMNNRGHIVGNELVSPFDRVVVTSDGAIVRRSPERHAWFAINARGWAVGMGWPPSELGGFATLWYPKGTVVTLPGPEESVANDINERGQIAGTAVFTPSDVHAVIWTVRGTGKK